MRGSWKLGQRNQWPVTTTELPIAKLLQALVSWIVGFLTQGLELSGVSDASCISSRAKNGKLVRQHQHGGWTPGIWDNQTRKVSSEYSVLAEYWGSWRLAGCEQCNCQLLLRTLHSTDHRMLHQPGYEPSHVTPLQCLRPIEACMWPNTAHFLPLPQLALFLKV